LTAPRPAQAAVVACVAVGGAAGALLRHGLTTVFPDRTGAFPWTILTVNVVGCLLLALLPGLGAVRRRPLLGPLLGPGLLGGFTTLSAYAGQTRALVADGHDLLAAAYVVGTLAACLVAVAAGARLVARDAEVR
jgi:CrcB protein